ncbi:hypothetical protein CSKR_111011 [Clonorchis sinensis]|uniref:Uncharacterized protein n=1 Tax=Clonorchis sinensis TaxID=79923 RepID=A0A3R7JKD7_CLOSI|nr:hypothetical protein CSKR_111011 [Clonorchis sinensis]
MSCSVSNQAQWRSRGPHPGRRGTPTAPKRFVIYFIPFCQIRQSLTEDFTPFFEQCGWEVIRTRGSVAFERTYEVTNLRCRSIRSHLMVLEGSITLPLDRLLVRGFAALGLAASVWRSWHGCTLLNEVPASVARGIIAALKPDHHVNVTATYTRGRLGSSSKAFGSKAQPRGSGFAGNVNALPFLRNKSPHVPTPNLEDQETVFVRPLAIDQPGMRDSVSVVGTPLSIA